MPVTPSVLPLFTVRLPELVRLPTVVKLALLASVRLLVFLFKLAKAFVAPDFMVPPCSVNVEELVVILIPLVVRSRLPPSTNVPPERVEPLICVSLAAVKLSPPLMVSVPVLLKLAAVVETLLPVPAMVSFPVLLARPARASLPPELLWMVPPASVRLAAFVVMVCAVPYRFRFAPST